MKHFFAWIFLFVLVQAVLSAVQFLLRNKPMKPAVRYVVIALKAVFATAFAGLVMAGPVFFRPLQPLLVAAYAALFADAVADLGCSVMFQLRKKQRKFAFVKATSLILGVLFFVYGTVNMQVVRPDYHVYESEKLSVAHKFVFLSDLHVGSSQSFQTTAKTIAAIQAQNPEFVILGGDITDDYTTKEEMENTYRLFGAMGVPVYYVDGNHEVVQHAKYMKNGLNYTYEELLKALQDNGIVILQDEFVAIGSDLLLFGREDVASSKRTEITDIQNTHPEKYLIMADHQPVRAQENMHCGMDLQLSGHTHAGQLFPLKFFYSFIGEVEGEYALEEGAKLLVSPGASGWRVPFRTDSACRFEVITLQPTA